MPMPVNRDVALHLTDERESFKPPRIPEPPDIPDQPSFMTDRKTIAGLGEDLAAQYLEQQGFQLVERNWHSGRFSEIDLIAVNSAGLMVFAEVKTRRLDPLQNGIPDAGFNAITRKKRQKLLGAAQSYLCRTLLREAAGRIDVIVVTFVRVAKTEKGDLCLEGANILHLPGAFEAF